MLFRLEQESRASANKSATTMRAKQATEREHVETEGNKGQQRDQREPMGLKKVETCERASELLPYCEAHAGS